MTNLFGSGNDQKCGFHSDEVSNPKNQPYLAREEAESIRQKWAGCFFRHIFERIFQQTKGCFISTVAAEWMVKYKEWIGSKSNIRDSENLAIS